MPEACYRCDESDKSIQEYQGGYACWPCIDHLNDHPDELEEHGFNPPDGGDNGGGEDPEWVEDYRAAQQKAKSLDIPANQAHEDLIHDITEALGDEA